MAILLIAVGAMMLPAMPSAMAMTPGLSTPDVVENSIADLEIISVKAHTETEAVAVYSDPVSGFNNGCTNAGAEGLPAVPIGETQWILRDNALNVAQITIVGITVSAGIPFGGGVTFDPTTAGVSVANAPLHWDETGTLNDGTPDDTTDVGGVVPDDYTLFVCGEDGSDDQNLGGYGLGGEFLIVAPVAGELIPINTTALLLAGVQANAFSVLASLAIIGAAGFGMLYFQINKKQ